jgi:hypothetical protein
LSITDNGKGMTQEVLKQVRTVGGSLTIESTPDDGTTVTLEMPLAQTPIWCAQNLNFSNAETIVVLDELKNQKKNLFRSADGNSA